MGRTWTTMLAACALTAALTACGSSAEDVADDIADVYNEMADVMEGVTDAESMDAARPKMRAIAERMQAMRAEMETMDEDDIAAESWDSSMNEEFMEASQRMQAAMMKLAMNPELAQPFGEMMQEFGESFSGN